MSSETGTSTEIEIIAAAVERLAERRSGELDLAEVDRLVMAAARLYTLAAEADPGYRLEGSRISATEALTLVAGLMGAHNINAFDLALWLSHARANEHPLKEVR